MQTENASPHTKSTLAESPPRALPPVSPPSPGFIMQLFVIPLIIVSMIVGIWLLIHWVVNRDMQPAELAKDIERLNHASWQQALTLANQLRDDPDNKLRGDHALCARLATQLQSRIDEAGTSQEQVWLRIYLCRALGEFSLTDGVPSLIAAVHHQADPRDLEVQRAALQSLIYLRNRLQDQPVWSRQDLLDATIQAATCQLPPRDENAPEGDSSGGDSLTLRYDRLHGTAAFLLGMLEDPRAAEALVPLLEDGSSDVRYNAAMGLARYGDPRCQVTLIEMLGTERVPEDQPPGTAGKQVVSKKEMDQWRMAKREIIVANALRGAELYAQKATQGQPELIEAVQQVAENATISAKLSRQARELLPLLQSQPKR